MSIFISLASYREPELRDTILSALENAKHPDSIHFGVYSQVESGEHPNLSDIANVTEVIVPSSQAKGAGYARSKAMELFNNQDYFLQIDAHSIFAKNWDTNIVALYKKIQEETHNDKIVISFWGFPYMRDQKTNKVIYQYEYGDWQVNCPHYTELVRYGDAWIGGRVEMPKGLDYHESAVALGGFIFAKGDIVREVPYDPDISWTGEEFMFSIRAYTRGWRIYSPYEKFLFHNYERHNNPRIWNDNRKWNYLEWLGKRKMYNALTLIDKSVWGIDDKKMYMEYQGKHGVNLIKEAKRLTKKYARRPRDV